MLRKVVSDDSLDLCRDLFAFTALKLDAHLHSQQAQRRSTRGS